MKVDFIIGRLGKGGAERVMATLSNHFSKMGHQVRIITFDELADGYDLHPSIERVRLTRSIISNVKLNRLFGLLSFYKKKNHRPDIAISFLTFTNLISILGCYLRRIPIIVSEHNNHTHTPKPAWLLKINWNYVYRLAKYVTVLTDFDVPFFKDRKANVVVMPNPSSFKNITTNTHKREKVILAVGSLNRIQHKGFDNLIKIMARVLPNYPDWKLRIAGGGDASNLQTLEQLVRKENLEKQVEFLGYCDHVRELMGKSSIYVLSSRFEGLPMVLLEAMSQGMACIAYDCVTGPSNMITHEVNGILVADQNMDEMVEQLDKLMQDEQKRLQLGSQALVSLDDYKIERIYEKWERLLPKRST